ncbi:MAG: tRNA pseudouridine(38-40) synthase TruA [Bryobacteraceae bacterium]|nr:tRNA pseudouridine(38-40) synthase TruA [Bryobacteraceae bacterium]
MRRILVTVAYDGTEFSGWQVQPGLTTIQGEIERVLAEIEGKPVHVDGSGRTDAGVHALAQAAAFNLENRIPCENLVKAMNRLLPRAIRIMDAAEAAPGFHPRYNAIAKTYEYRIWRGAICPPTLRLYVYHHPYALEESRMGAAAAQIEGEHDFTAFSASDPSDALGRSKVRTVYSSWLNRDGDLLTYRVRGSGFLKHMVRMIAGTLLEAGKGNLTRDDIDARLQPGFPGKAGPALPASGLFLISVEY